MNEAPSVDELAVALVAGLPALDERGMSVARGTYRELARGAPVTHQAIAERVGLSTHEVVELLTGWPDVAYDDADRIIGFFGLSIEPTAHALDTGGVCLYTWCAWDTLFLPAILGTTATVTSTDPHTSEPVRLVVTPEAITERSHPDLAVSFVTPDGAADVRTNFCQFVHFFTHPASAQAWISGRDSMFTLPLDAAHELGQRRNQARGLTDQDASPRT